jgi:hypothetical protein
LPFPRKILCATKKIKEIILIKPVRCKLKCKTIDIRGYLLGEQMISSKKISVPVCKSGIICSVSEKNILPIIPCTKGKYRKIIKQNYGIL